MELGARGSQRVLQVYLPHSNSIKERWCKYVKTLAMVNLGHCKHICSILSWSLNSKKFSLWMHIITGCSKSSKNASVLFTQHAVYTQDTDAISLAFLLREKIHPWWICFLTLNQWQFDSQRSLPIVIVHLIVFYKGSIKETESAFSQFCWDWKRNTQLVYFCT